MPMRPCSGPGSSAAPAGRADAGEWARAARCDRGGAERRDRRQGRLDRRLPPRGRRPGLLPGSVFGPPASRPAVPALRPTVRKIVVGGRGPTCASTASHGRAGPAGRPRLSGRQQLLEPPRAVRRQQLWKPPIVSPVDHDLRERDHPRDARELGATVRVACQIDLLVRDRPARPGASWRWRTVDSDRWCRS